MQMAALATISLSLQFQELKLSSVSVCAEEELGSSSSSV
jgi:hypothetical protein